MNKYRNKRVWAFGRWWDSQFEYNYYYYLLEKEKQGIINDLQIQVPFTLIDKSKYGTAIKYIADFVYYKDNKMVVVDAKGVKTPTYKLKARLFAERYGFEIKEVRNDSKWSV